MEKSKKKVELYRYPYYPLVRATSKLPGDILIDRQGNCYEVNDDLKIIMICESVLREKYQDVLTLTNRQFYKLFKILTTKKLALYGKSVLEE